MHGPLDRSHSMQRLPEKFHPALTPGAARLTLS